MKLKAIGSGNNRQFICIKDIDLIDEINSLLPYYSSFNSLINDALKCGIPEIARGKTDRTISIEDDEQGLRIQEEKSSEVDYRMSEIVELLTEIVLNTTLIKSMLCGLYNVKEEELKTDKILGDRFKRGLYNNTPDCLYETEINMLRQINGYEGDDE
ncbi:MAG: hypothetical protein J6N93_03440 [Clostridia bacterium]|nr:hypothetical protein [Clostridia bacterium]